MRASLTSKYPNLRVDSTVLHRVGSAVKGVSRRTGIYERNITTFEQGEVSNHSSQAEVTSESSDYLVIKDFLKEEMTEMAGELQMRPSQGKVEMGKPIYWDESSKSNFITLSHVPKGDVTELVINGLNPRMGEGDFVIDGIFNVSGRKMSFVGPNGENFSKNTANVKYVI